jgi:hypothetical protein
VLDGLFVTPTVTAIGDALTSARAEGTIAVVGNAKLATVLSATRDVIPVGLRPRAARKLPRAIGDTLSLEPNSLAAVIGTDITGDAAWEATLRAWSRVVKDGGAIIFVDRGGAAEASRRALCAGLTELEQRHAGRQVITSGLVTHL